jgi:hypothetical protein
MKIPAERFPRSTLVLLIAIAALPSVVIAQQRKEARLEAALAHYKSRSHGLVVQCIDQMAILNWPDESPLGEVVEQIKMCTTGRRPRVNFPAGIPIAVDPVGLERAGRSLRSPVPSPPSDPGLTLGEKLRTVLEPLGLACDVKDASLVITARDMVPEPVEQCAQHEE